MAEQFSARMKRESSASHIRLNIKRFSFQLKRFILPITNLENQAFYS